MRCAAQASAPSQPPRGPGPVGRDPPLPRVPIPADDLEPAVAPLKVVKGPAVAVALIRVGDVDAVVTSVRDAVPIFVVHVVTGVPKAVVVAVLLADVGRLGAVVVGVPHSVVVAVVTDIPDSVPVVTSTSTVPVPAGALTISWVELPAKSVA